MTVRFPIFRKSKKFHINFNWLVLGILALLVSVGFLNERIVSVDQHAISQAFGWAIITTIVLGYVRRLFFIGRPEKLHGVLEGFLEFRPECVVIDVDEIPLADIESVEIDNTDYWGKTVGSPRGFTSTFSAGVDNTLTIRKINGSIIRVHFALNHEYEMGHLQEVLTDYHLKGKMSFDNLVTVLKFSNKEIGEMRHYLAGVRAGLQ